MNERRSDSVLKAGYMVKRSQNKKRFTPVNYKTRWFELTRLYLSYYDIGNLEKRRERGRISVRGVRLVEPAILHGEGGDTAAPEGYPFQVGYCESDGIYPGTTLPQYTLYLVADSEKDRADWIVSIRKVCEEYSPKSFRYHPSLWQGRKWSCCKSLNRRALGCQVATLWPEYNNNPSNGSSPAQNSSRSISPNTQTHFPNGHLQQGSQHLISGSGLDRTLQQQQQQQTPNQPGNQSPQLLSQQQQPNQQQQLQPQGPNSQQSSHSPSLQHQQLQHQQSSQSHHLNSSSSSLGNITPTFAQPQSPTHSFKTASINGAGHHTNGGELNMPGGPTAAPGTPNSKAKDVSPRVKIVVALYPFKAIESGDLSLEKNAEYEVIDDSQEHWWKVKDQHGTIGYIPSNYVKEKELLGLQKYDWYVGDMSRQRAESLLKQNDKEGCFVVRKSSTKGLYTLSLHTKVPQSHVKHYHIKQNARSEFYLSEKHCCESIPDLINYHRHNSGGLACRLKTSPCDRPVPPTAGLSHDKWEIHPSELMILEELGSGQFGVVRRAKWRGSIDTAVKMMKVGTMSEDDFIEEAKVMTKLQHPNLVQLYGVCSKHRPIYIITEYMKHGSLLNYLRRHEQSLIGNMGLLLDMCIQVCKGMSYLERHNYIHRDLAARNCLVGSENTVKVADFGLARYVLDDQYTSSGGTKFPIKWAPPEVLNYTRFSSKSDVWAYGVLMWEVFTCGKMPYGRLKNTEVVERVQRGIILEKPKTCAKEIYDVMKKCWSHSPEDRPGFRILKDQLAAVAQGLTD
ncbi:tyrosine-protein kinase Btk29A isoform X1 [Aedes aegypti]|uniref:Tyrosine-protein kinase n=2 Tax=Aedes aegypti TaxID=7159 RepID=A0A6I8TSP2_AEDAE|nr:tyrosine-protein kinase Btk29A isoform X1 [Aedes aegypti]XP_021702038.1 tyrosine-protein kinase Btk29A isoform X1 [Aedes aegypti]XP_021702039.1 tyrosine-protein kinase Btk29A isoform X1 [Aedes aegypti]